MVGRHAMAMLPTVWVAAAMCVVAAALEPGRCVDLEGTNRSTDVVRHVVLMHLTASLPRTHYVWDMIRILKRSNPQMHVHLIVFEGVQAPPLPFYVHMVDGSRLPVRPEWTLLKAPFLAAYGSTMENAEWEWKNVERFGYLEAFLLHGGFPFDRVWTFDSDVAVIKRLPTSGLACDSYVHVPSAGNTWSTLRWTAWAGTAVVSVKLIEQFRETLVWSVSDAHIMAMLSRKARERPAVCDMTLWYLTVVRMSGYFYRVFNVTARGMDAPAALGNDGLCDLACVGQFDNRWGDLAPGFVWSERGYASSTSPLMTVHFQGHRKGVMQTYARHGYVVSDFRLFIPWIFLWAYFVLHVYGRWEGFGVAVVCVVYFLHVSLQRSSEREFV